MLDILSRQTFALVSFLPVSIACCQISRLIQSTIHVDVYTLTSLAAACDTLSFETLSKTGVSAAKSAKKAKET